YGPCGGRAPFSAGDWPILAGAGSSDHAWCSRDGVPEGIPARSRPLLIPPMRLGSYLVLLFALAACRGGAEKPGKGKRQAIEDLFAGPIPSLELQIPKEAINSLRKEP